MKSLQNVKVFSISPKGDFVFLHDRAIWRLPPGGLTAEVCVADVPEHYCRLVLADDGDTVGACTTLYVYEKGVHVYSLASGKTIWSAGIEADRIEFSPDSKLMLWEFTRLWHSGSDVLEFVVVRLADGESLLTEERTTYNRSAYFAHDGKAVLCGWPGELTRVIYPLPNEEKIQEARMVGALGLDSIPPFHNSLKTVKAQFGRWKTGRRP